MPVPNMRVLFCFTILLVAGLAADPSLIEKGKAEERRACVGCHGLQIIHVQRLSRAVWDRELTKMVNWGAQIREREALLEYLATSFSEDKPPAELRLSAEGTARK
ncbi:MAG: hypothetical protein NZV14_04495 [Bryobacteraceae bacterium]|nr:hypothetical protein [Bryobacteraceae bacterium]MDW8377393.1 hypothetical protein [Bryobacterales bacterium]